jgi:hypothetical protein
MAGKISARTSVVSWCGRAAGVAKPAAVGETVIVCLNTNQTINSWLQFRLLHSFDKAQLQMCYFAAM